MLEIYPELVPILKKIDFVKRYETISNKYRDEENCFEKFEPKEVIDLVKTLGYEVTYNKSDRFFKIKEKLKDFDIQFNLILKYGICEFVWAIKYKGEFWPIGGPWAVIADLLLRNEEPLPLPLPVFSSYNDLNSIIQLAFSIYDDFKKELMLQEYTQE